MGRTKYFYIGLHNLLDPLLFRNKHNSILFPRRYEQSTKLPSFRLLSYLEPLKGDAGPPSLVKAPIQKAQNKQPIYLPYKPPAALLILFYRWSNVAIMRRTGNRVCGNSGQKQNQDCPPRPAAPSPQLNRLVAEPANVRQRVVNIQVAYSSYLILVI